MPGFGLGFKRLILVLGDLAVYQAALALMLIVRYGSLTERDWELHAIPFAIVSLLWVVGAYVAGLYDLNQMKNGVKFFRLYLEGMLANLAVAFAFFYLVQIFGIAPRTNLVLYFAFALLLGYGTEVAASIRTLSFERKGKSVYLLFFIKYVIIKEKALIYCILIKLLNSLSLKLFYLFNL
jgi:hypothetical protein